MIARSQAIALGLAAVIAVAMPLLLLPAGPSPVLPPPDGLPEPLKAPEFPPLAEAYARPLFGAAPAGAIAELPEDAPALVGIVGRLDRDAIALVRTSAGESRSLKIGESVDGWRLESLAIDAAFFTRGSERVRVPLPDGEPQ